MDKVEKPKARFTNRVDKPNPRPKAKGKNKDVVPPVLDEAPPLIEGEIKPEPTPEQMEVILHNAANQLQILPNDAEESRVFKLIVSLDQKGMVDKDGNVIDPNNNTFKRITVEAKGKLINIAQIAGKIGEQLYDFGQTIKASSGIAKKHGFNVNLEMIDIVNEVENNVTITSVSKVRMSSPINIAFAVANAILTQVEGSNAEANITGDWQVSEAGKLLMKKMHLQAANMPLFTFKKVLGERRKEINKNVSEVAKAALENKKA